MYCLLCEEGEESMLSDSKRSHADASKAICIHRHSVLRLSTADTHQRLGKHAARACAQDLLQQSRALGRRQQLGTSWRDALLILQVDRLEGLWVDVLDVYAKVFVRGFPPIPASLSKL